MSGDIVNGVIRQAEIWALVGATLAVWIAISRGEPERIPTLALAGLVLGAIGGALGGAILNVPKELATEMLDREEATRSGSASGRRTDCSSAPFLV